MSSEAIIIRTKRLDNIILGQQDRVFNNNTLTRECLLDAFFLLYNECDKEILKKRDKNIAEFITKYRSIIDETKCLRVSMNDFTEKALIGKGYFGNVHLVVENATGDVYALKKIKKSVVTAFQVKEERDIMSRRSSEWITNLQYSFQDTDFLYLVMEYLPGGDLLSLMIRNGPFEEELVKFYLAEISMAINELHNMGYVHRDIKPENILVDRLGHLKLADFGNAAILNKDGQVVSLSPVGTPYYIAPELLQTISSLKASQVTHDASCDFWSMGIIGFEMVYETTPFYNENVNETYSKILGYSEDNRKMEKIKFPEDIKVSEIFKNLIENLITKPSQRLSFTNIANHKFFQNVKWNSLHQEVPPIIPSVKHEEDVSNFEDIERIRGKHNTFVRKTFSTNIKANDFSGKDLPFLGYGFIQQEPILSENLIQNSVNISKFTKQIKELEQIINRQRSEIKCLQESLLNAEMQAKQSNSTSKILSDAKDEIIRMKERLQQKTIELAQCKTEVKTLQSSLRIEEEHRVKNDAKISEVLSATYKKWERAKELSDQKYEKQIAEKKTEIMTINEKLKLRENELSAKSVELQHLHAQVDNFKERLQNVREQASIDKKEFEEIKLKMQESYEAKLHTCKVELSKEKDNKNRLTCELRDVRNELDESIQSSNNTVQAKMTTEKNINEIRQRLNREIELNNTLRSENTRIEKIKAELEKSVDNLRFENEKLKQESQLREATKIFSFESATSSQYQSAHGSLTELHAMEEQLRNDLAVAKEGEDKQRCRADQLEKIVAKLENMIGKITDQPNVLGNVLEKQNEKLEDKLATVREQMVLERQSARTANLSLWKAEKQIEDLQNEKKTVQRRLELTEDKVKRIQSQKTESDIHIKELNNEIKIKDEKIDELKGQINNLKIDNQKEHEAWKKAEKERMQEKSEVIENINKIHNLNQKCTELNQKLLQARSKQDSLNLEVNRLIRELNEERNQSSNCTDLTAELQQKLKSLQENYEMLKVACSITDEQLTQIEILYDTEVKKSNLNQEKIDDLYKILKEKEEVISQLKKDLNLETSNKINVENKVKSLESEYKELKANMEHVHKQLLSQQNQLIHNTNDLFGTQEKLELITTESTNLQVMNENFEKEINILKEENAKILTELFIAKEHNYNLKEELKNSNHNILRLEAEVDQANNSLEDQKNFYKQREIKSEATLMQYQKLIDYLQLKVEDLSQKKKKSLANKIFGGTTPNSKKENTNPNHVEGSILYRKMQEELNREKQKNKILQEKVEKNKEISQNEEMAISYNSSETHPNKMTNKSNLNDYISQNVVKNDKNGMELIKKEKFNEEVSIVPRNENQIVKNHRFELNLETNNKNLSCLVCSLPIASGSPYWACKECKFSVHRKCRGDVNTACGFTENSQVIEEKNLDNYNGDCDIISLHDKNYIGKFIMNADILNPSLEINCAYELFPDTILLGTTTGLFVYGTSSKSILKITGIKDVQYISTSLILSKVLFAANDGYDLLQCDLRQLQTRSQSKFSINSILETKKINLSEITEYRDKYHIVKISNEVENAISTSAIAAGSYQIIIMKYDNNLQSFKPIRSFQSPSTVLSILFTRHTAIIAADKFLEIDLATFTTEEFIDFSDPSLNHLQNYQPMNVFNVSPQEYLICFAECGIFVDEYGCRSRPYELTWEYSPTGFLYQEPFLYISHFQLVQVVRLHRSYRNETANISSDDSSSLKRIYLNIYMSTLLTNSGNDNCYALALNRENGIQQLFLLESLKALKNIYVSTETLSSQATCLTIDSESSNLS